MDMSASCVAELLVRVTNDQRCHVTLPRQNNGMFGFFWYVSVIQPRGSKSGRQKRLDESFQVRAKEPLGTVKFKRMSAPDWAQKSLCIIVPNQRTASPEFFSCVRTRRLLSRHTCLVRSPRLCVHIRKGSFHFLLP